MAMRAAHDLQVQLPDPVIQTSRDIEACFFIVVPFGNVHPYPADGIVAFFVVRLQLVSCEWEELVAMMNVSASSHQRRFLKLLVHQPCFCRRADLVLPLVWLLFRLRLLSSISLFMRMA